MPRIVGIAAAALVYLMASCAIVSALGRAHRAGLKPAPQVVETKVEIDRPIGLPEPSATPSAPPPAERIEIARAPEPAPEPRPIPRPPTAPDPAPVAAEASPTPALAPPARPAEVGPPELEVFASLDPLLVDEAAKKRWNLKEFDIAAEMRLGEELHRRVMLPKLNRRHWEEAMQTRIDEAAAPILAARTRQDVKYKFHVLDDPLCNAFSHPGGHVYLSRGLMNVISEDQDYALRFILAHEIAHVDQGHAIRALRDPALSVLPYGTVQLFFLFVFPGGYGAKFEEQADDWAFSQMQRLQMSRRETLTFLSILSRYASENGFPLGAESIDKQAPIPLFDLHIRTHPPARERHARLKERLDQAVKKAG